MAVAPILRGQKLTEKNIIPPLRHSSEQHSPFSVATTAKSHPSTEENDLIDFGQNEGPAAHFPADLKAAQTDNNGQQEKDLEHTLRSAGISLPRPTDALIDFHEDLKRNIPVLKRESTDGSIDEFVDAES